MSLPSISSYKDALRIAEHSLRQLNHLRPVEGQNGDLYFSSGAFAVVFKMRDTRDGSFKALKCFTRHQERRRESLEWISTYLDWVGRRYIIPYEYYKDELWAEESDHPVLLMDWVEGETLGNYVQKLCARQEKDKIKELCERFVKMALWLLDQPWAHGDLKHDNIIVRPDGSLVLVDYDGCFIPGMEGQPARELGSPAFQHPQREASNFDRHIDDFSILVIFLSLQLLIADPDLFSKNANGENLVLGNADIQNPASSNLFSNFRQSRDKFLKIATALLDLAVALPPGRVFGLLEVLNEFRKSAKAGIPHFTEPDLHRGMVSIPRGVTASPIIADLDIVKVDHENKLFILSDGSNNYQLSFMLAEESEDVIEIKDEGNVLSCATWRRAGGSSTWLCTNKQFALHEGMVFIPGGTFLMGDVMQDNEHDNETVHEVTLSAYQIGACEVTFEEYDTFCAATKREKPIEPGWSWGRGKRPVINVSWEDAIAYCNWLSEQKGFEEVYTIHGEDIIANWQANGYRLPTEAEWEYAARAGGKKVRFGNGKDIADPKEINFDASADYKEAYPIEGEYSGATLPVGSFAPNALGLYDMSGNVWEWCWDWYGSYPTFAQTNPKGSSTGPFRVLRGGSCLDGPQFCRVAYREIGTPSNHRFGIGFRLSQTPFT